MARPRVKRRRQVSVPSFALRCSACQALCRFWPMRRCGRAARASCSHFSGVAAITRFIIIRRVPGFARVEVEPIDLAPPRVPRPRLPRSPAMSPASPSAPRFLRRTFRPAPAAGAGADAGREPPPRWWPRSRTPARSAASAAPASRPSGSPPRSRRSARPLRAAFAVNLFVLGRGAFPTTAHGASRAGGDRSAARALRSGSRARRWRATRPMPMAQLEVLGRRARADRELSPSAC